jgi:hypothetical protein
LGDRMLCRLFSSFVVVGLLASSGACHAAVYDFGNLSIASSNFAAAPGSFVQRASGGKSFGNGIVDQNISNNSFNRFNEGASTSPFGFNPEQGAKKSVAGLRDGNLLLASVTYDDMQPHGQRSVGGYSINLPVKAPATEAPALAPYTMMLAGFGLLFLSARRRKSDTFD